jgi:hypothetical protein
MEDLLGIAKIAAVLFQVGASFRLVSSEHA